MVFEVGPMNDTSAMLNLIAQRQKVLGENLANIDTPGYERKDIDFSQFMGSTGSPLETQLSSKMGSSYLVNEKNGGPVNPANELLELQKNSLLYTMATRRMSNIITEMKTVINVGK